MKKVFIVISIINISLFSSCKIDNKTNEESLKNKANSTQIDSIKDKTSINVSDNKTGDNIKIVVLANPGPDAKVDYKAKIDSSLDIYTSPEQMPQYPGGEESLMNYIKMNLKYPTISVENGIQGQVIIRFVVDKKGKIKDVLVLRSIDAACDKEAIRVVKSLPKRWTPGKQNGKPVDVYYTLPIRFKLETE